MRGLFAATRLLSLLAALALVAGCTTSRPEDALFGEDDPDEGFVLENFQARIFNGCDLETLIEAKKGQLDSGKGVVRLESVLVQYYTTGTLVGTFTSEGGLFYLEDRPEVGFSRNDLRLLGDVNLVYGDVEIWTPTLRYNATNPETTFASTGEAFDLRMPMDNGNAHLIGRRFEAHVDMTQLQLLSHGPGILTIEPKEPPAAAEPQDPKKGSLEP